MRQHVASPTCWCKPLSLQVCPRCIDNPDIFCARCKNKRLVPPYNKKQRLSVILHDHTESMQIQDCDTSIHMFMCRAGDKPQSWEKIVQFFLGHIRESGKHKKES